MKHRAVATLCSTALLLTGGCSGSGQEGAGGASIDAATQADDASNPTDTAAWVPVADISTGSDTTAPPTSDFGSPCTENADCESGYCVEGPEGDICTKTCSEACPDGYQCKGGQGLGTDVVFICVPILTNLCNPCQDDTQCVEGTCHEMDGASYCVTGCEGDVDCPTSYLCSVDEEGQGACVPATGSCTCYPEFDGGQRPCWTATGAGECFGTETCEPASGWTGCTASEPAPETCDYRDDDCDGVVDEAFKDESGVYDGYLNCGACNVSCAFGFPNSAATECNTSGPQPQCQVVACLPGYVQLNAYQCVPEGASLCQPCEEDAACLGEGAECLTTAEGSFCGEACGSPDDCPDGYGCELLDGATLYQCVPSSGSCTCNELNLGLSRACVETWTPGSPDEVAYACPGSETCSEAGWGSCVLPDEACDGVDDDCDGAVDEDFRDDAGLYSGVDHCGGCGISCLALLDAEAHATAICDVSEGFPACTYACVDGYIDVDGLSDNGCECLPGAGQDIPDTSGPGGTGVDSDCDGIDGEQEQGLFVSKNGDDGSSGAFGAPKKTIQAAIDAAAATGLDFVYVATGAYVEAVTLTDGVRVYGGYSADFSVRDPVGYETVIIGTGSSDAVPGTVNAIGVGTGALSGVEGFVIFGAASANPGGSSYAIYLRECGANLTLRHNTVFAGDGSDGFPGGSGFDGPSGAAGAQGAAANWLGGPSCSTSDHSPGGTGGATSCDGVGTQGGDGGARICPDAPAAVQTTAQTPDPSEHGAPGAGSGGAGGEAGWDSAIGVTTCGICSSNYEHASEGADGAAGGGGFNGVVAPSCGAGLGAVTVSGLWSPFPGGDGFAGTAGGGGGGGGAGGGVDTHGCGGESQVAGGSGGGGGAGGCGGAGGYGGQAGGGSFAIFASWSGAATSLPTIADNAIYQGRGGTGGAGGQGGLGGAAGDGGAGGASGQGTGDWPINICGAGGGYGGAGGLGGHGSGGAGGCGGVSYGIYLHAGGGVGNTAPVSGNSVIQAGVSGPGGTGGASYGASGPDGTQGAVAVSNF